MAGIFGRGGIMVYLILIVSVAAVAVILERVVYFIRTREDLGSLLERISRTFMEAGRETAKEEATGADSPGGRFLSAGLSAPEGSSREEVLHRLEDAGKKEAFLFHRYLRVLSAAAGVAPLMGLLGTVIGMIEAFRKINEASGGMIDPQALAEGIWKALITTALGLSVAIPCYIAYHLLAGLAEKRLTEMELAGDQIVDMVSGGKK